MAVRLIESIAHIKEHTRLDGGGLQVRAIARHPGVLTYRDSHGNRNEFVSPSFLRSLDDQGFPISGSLANLPVTLEHPPTLLRQDSELTDKYRVGQTTPQVKVYKDGRVEVLMEITDSAAVEAVISGEKPGVSLGYTCNVVRKDGHWEGQPYQYEQSEPYQADHLALVAKPRAPMALIQNFGHLDSNGEVAIAVADAPKSAVSDVRGASLTATAVKTPREDNMGTENTSLGVIAEAPTYQIDIGGKPFHVDSDLYEALQQERVDMEQAIEDAEEDNKEVVNTDHVDGLADSIEQLLIRLDAENFDQAAERLDSLLSRFDGAESLNDAIQGVDQMQGRLDAISHLDMDDDDDEDEKTDGLDELLDRFDADSVAEVLEKIDSEAFMQQYSEMLPANFDADGLTLYDLQLAAIEHTRPGMELRNDSEDAVEGAFSILAAKYTRTDNSEALDAVLAPRSDAFMHELPPRHNRATGVSYRQPVTTQSRPSGLSSKVFNISTGGR